MFISISFYIEYSKLTIKTYKHIYSYILIINMFISISFYIEYSKLTIKTYKHAYKLYIKKICFVII